MTPRSLPGVLAAVLAAGALTKTATISATGGFVAISVRDVDAATQWYQDVFDLKVTLRTPHERQARIVVLGGPGIIVELVQHDSARDEPGDPALRHGLMKGGWIVSDFDSAVAQLRARNIPIAYGPFPSRPNAPANLIVRDNEGNLIQLFGR